MLAVAEEGGYHDLRCLRLTPSLTSRASFGLGPPQRGLEGHFRRRHVP